VSHSQPHELYRPIELTFAGTRVVPADRTPLTLRLRHAASGAERVVPGFWDGGTTYRARFAPDLEGTWTWESESDEAALNGATGQFEVVRGDEHGPVRVAHRFHFAHADGTPFRPVGTTAYNWLQQGEPLFSSTVDAIAEAGFNKFRFMVFPQGGGYIEHVPTLMPFETTDGRWDVTKPVPTFFQRLDRAVEVLGDRGIQADVLIYNAYDRGQFGLNELTEEEDAIYLRYLVARLAAYPHVWWSLCNEFDQLERPAERWDRTGALLAEIDPYDHLRSIHNWIELHDNNQPWITHASIQNGSATTEFGRANLYRDVYSTRSSTRATSPTAGATSTPSSSCTSSGSRPWPGATPRTARASSPTRGAYTWSRAGRCAATRRHDWRSCDGSSRRSTAPASTPSTSGTTRPMSPASPAVSTCSTAAAARPRRGPSACPSACRASGRSPATGSRST
jgi:hypothetical protein